MNTFFLADTNFDLNKGYIGIGNFVIKNEQIIDGAFTLLKIVLVLVVMYLVIKIGSTVIDKAVHRQKNLKFSLDTKKAKTIGQLLKSILRYTVYFFGIIEILSMLGLFGTISLTFAGIGGVAIGLGAQSLIKDVINGFFILLEDQYSVSDYVTIDDKSGIVESIELRLTKIRDFNGDLHLIPNGSISRVTNHSRGNMRIMLDIDIAYDKNVDLVQQIIDQVCNSFKEQNPNMVEGPKVLGVSALKEDCMTLRVVGKSKPMTQWDCEMKLREDIRSALKREGIRINRI